MLLNLLLHIVSLILMAVPRDVLTSIVNSNQIYKMYYLTILLLLCHGYCFVLKFPRQTICWATQCSAVNHYLKQGKVN